MGRAIINANDIHNADKRDAFSIGRWDGTALVNNFCGMRAVVDTGVNTGEANDNHSFVSFHTWGNSIANSREVMRINQRGNLGLNTTQPRERLDLIGNLIVRSAAEATNATLFFGTPNNPSAALKVAIIAQSINSWSRANLCFCLDDNANNAASFNAGTNNIRMIITPSGFVGIGNTLPETRLHVTGRFFVNNGGLGNPANGVTGNDGARVILWPGDGNNTAYALGMASSTLWYGVPTGATHRWFIGTTNSMTLNGSGFLGIGNAAPSARLDVAAGSFSSPFTNVRWFNYNGFSGQFPSTTIGNLCAIFRSDVMVQSQLVISSDSRIKKNIQNIEDDSALQKILAIQPKTYNYVDMMKSTSNVYGFIAQQVREVIPEAVKLQNEYIPNIYDSCTYTSNVLTFHNSNLNTTDIHIGSNIKIFDWDSKEHICKITDYTSNSITIDENIQNSCNICFAHGTQVDDFHALDKNYIYTLNVCAVQELYKMIQKQNDIISTLMNRIAALEK
jgi:hypothetical protein